MIPSRFPPIGAFDTIATPADLAAVMELEGWTNDRLVAERLARLPETEWVFGVPNASIVMAAFLQAAPSGSRFSGPDLGAWYCGAALNTAIAEVAHHLRRKPWRGDRPRAVASSGAIRRGCWATTMSTCEGRGEQAGSIPVDRLRRVEGLWREHAGVEPVWHRLRQPASPRRHERGFLPAPSSHGHQARGPPGRLRACLRQDRREKPRPFRRISVLNIPEPGPLSDR